MFYSDTWVYTVIIHIREDSANDREMNLTVTGEKQIGTATPEIERCGTHMLRPLSSSGLSMADDDDCMFPLLFLSTSTSYLDVIPMWYLLT